MTTAVELLSFIPTGASAKRSLAAWTGDVVNVLNFPGVDPTGVGDSTAGIQAALDAAFGTAASPHGSTNPQLNKKVFFPSGKYNVSPAHSSKVITNVTCDNSGGAGIGLLTYTTGSAHGFSNGDTVFVDGGTGTGTFNGTKVIQNAAGSSFKTVTTQTFTSYTGSTATVRVPSLLVTAVYGGMIEGSGMESTQIICPTDIAFLANGFKHSSIRNIGFYGNSTGFAGCILDMDCPQTGSTTIDPVSTVSFYDCQAVLIQGTGGAGFMIGPTKGGGGDTVAFYNCNLNQCIHGVDIGRNNNTTAKNVSFFEGNGLANTTAIYNWYGTIGIVCGMLFESSVSFDIVSVGAATIPHTPLICGVTTESDNFCNLSYANATLIANNSRGPGTGATFIFLIANLPCSIMGGFSNLGECVMQNGGSIRDFWWQRADAIRKDATCQSPVRIENMMLGGTPYTPASTNNFINYVKGFFINNAAGTTQYFVGEKHVSAAGTTQSNTLMLVADLPPAATVGTAFTTGVTVTVHDATVAQTSANKNSTVAGSSSNKVEVINNGTNWVIV